MTIDELIKILNNNHFYEYENPDIPVTIRRFFTSDIDNRVYFEITDKFIIKVIKYIYDVYTKEIERTYQNDQMYTLKELTEERLNNVCNDVHERINFLDKYFNKKKVEIRKNKILNIGKRR